MPIGFKTRLPPENRTPVFKKEPVPMLKIKLAPLSLALTTSLFLACNKKESAPPAAQPGKAVAWNNTREEAFTLFHRMSVTGCAYKVDAKDTATSPEAKCETAVSMMNSDGKWKQDWLDTLAIGLDSLQLDSLCLNYTRVFSGGEPIPVSQPIIKNIQVLQRLQDDAAWDLAQVAQ
jgi:hypothetical protein